MALQLLSIIVAGLILLVSGNVKAAATVLILVGVFTLGLAVQRDYLRESMRK